MSARAIVDGIRHALPAAIDLITDLVRAGLDPKVEIERIRRSDRVLARARAEARWAEALDEHHPQTHPPNTEPGGPPDDPYEDL